MRRVHNGSSRILGQVQVPPANVEPGRVLGLRPGQVASRPGRALDRAYRSTLRIMENESQ